MLITLHGKLAQDYGAEHRIQADNIADAVRGLSLQLNMFDGIPIDQRPTLRIIGCDEESDLEKNPDKIDIILAMRGGGGFGKFLLGAALIGLSFIPGAAAGTFLLGKFTGAAFGLGVSLALSGVAQIFTKAPSLSKETDPDASKYLGLANNTTKLGTLRSYSMGRVKITAPHVIAVNVDSNDMVKGEFPE